ncbi:AraC family transcriptional regulator, partial [Leptospira sp. SA-E8]
MTGDVLETVPSADSMAAAFNDANSGESARHYALVAKAIRYLRDNFQGDLKRQPSLAELAAAVHVSEYHLQRVFTAWAGISPKRFLQYLS